MMMKCRKLYYLKRDVTDDQKNYWCSLCEIIIVFPVAVVIAFFVCWAPYHTQRLMFVYVTLYGQWTDNLKFVNQHLFYFAGKQAIMTQVLIEIQGQIMSEY